MQEIIVYIILTIVAAVLIYHIYKKATGKNRGCSCGSCPMNDGECSSSQCGQCHCHDAQQ